MSFWISFAVLLLFYAAASDATQWLNQIENDKEYDLETFEFKEDKPFLRRNIGQATIWKVPERTSFSIHFIPREHCQEVWVCSTPWKKGDAVDKKVFSTSSKKGKPCDNLHVFRPLEQSVEINADYNNGGYSLIRKPVTEKKHIFPWAKATFVNNGQAGSISQFNLEVATEDRDTQGGVSGKDSKQVTIRNWPMIITSSPYCKVEVKADTSNGKPIDFINVGNLTEFPYWNMKEDEGDVKKTFNGLLVRTAVKQYRVTTKSQCPSLWKPEFEPIYENWATARSNMKTDSVYFTYLLKKTADCKLGTDNDKPKDPTKLEEFVPASETERASIKIQIENPEMCNWLRICFLEGDTKSMCMDPEKSIEIMPVYKLFVGVDSDEARRLDVPSNELTHFRFDLTRQRDAKTKDSTDKYRLTMGYSFANDLPGVEYHMYAKKEVYEKWLTGDQRVSLIRDTKCRARLVTDYMLHTDNKKGKQCLKVSKCDVAVVEKMSDDTPAKEYTQARIDANSLNIK